MKSQFLKMAGVKSDAAFYQKFPTEESFFQAYPDAEQMVNGGELEMFNEYDEYDDVPIAQAGLSMPSSAPSFNPTNFNFDPKFANMANAVKPMNLQNAGAVGFGKGAGAINSAGGVGAEGLKSMMGKAAPFVGSAMDLVEGFSMIRGQNEAVAAADQNAQVTGIQSQASETREEQQRRQFVRPEDSMVQPDQLFPTYGVGSNVLAARNGAEIQNTYAPNTLYDDLGYEPLEDSEIIKQYKSGGLIPRANFGDIMKGGGGDILGNLTSNIGSGGRGPTAGNKIGGGLGGAVGTFFGGPVGGMLGKAAGSAIGGLIDSSGRKINAFEEQSEGNINNIMNQAKAKGFQQQFSNVLEDGGYIDAQVIEPFTNYSMEDLLQAPYDTEMLRAGGNLKSYTPPSEQSMQPYAMGGEVKTHWGGEAETLSQNPYSPGTGETIMFRGQSHDESDNKGRSGIGVSYGSAQNGMQAQEANVEVERGEPAQVLEDLNTGEENMVVFGNLKIPNEYISELDSNAKNKKFKNYIADLSKIEVRQNKIIDKVSLQVNDLDAENSFDKLKLSSLESRLLGANMKLKDIANKKQTAASIQSAINDTAEEYGIMADELAKGKYKIDKKAILGQAKNGIEMAQDGAVKKATEFKTKAEAEAAGYKLRSDGKYVKVKTNKSTISKNKETASSLKDIPNQSMDKNTGFFGGITSQQFEDYKKANPWFDWNNFDPKNEEQVKGYQKAFNDKAKSIGSDALMKIDGLVGKQFVSGKLDLNKTDTALESDSEDVATVTEENKKFPFIKAANQLIPYLRPTDQEQLDPNQLMGELYALSSNQVEPVDAQTYRPQLTTPYDISLQDQLNEVTAQTNTAMRQYGGDPSTLAAISAQADMAKSKILGEQFRMNQGMKNQVYNQNIATLNDAQGKNLQILDQQANRQSQARSNTRAVTQEAISSISSKYAQNNLSNRTLATYENMYNYRFDRNGRARNFNELVDFEEMINNGKQSSKPGEETAPAGYEFEKVLKKKKAETAKKETARNGSIVRALKNL